MKPFIKWVGGKTQLLGEISKRYPEELGNRIDKYCEPFVGGGAVLIDILTKYEIKEILINDINDELINTYIQIKNNVDALIEMLDKLQEEYICKEFEDRQEYYYIKRERFNETPLDDNTSLEKAALFIFLNKTCFNGLYRVNSKGKFNVSMGVYKSPLICDKTNLLKVHEKLQKVDMRTGNYSDTIDFIDANTFVYIDPPYRPLNMTTGFTSYSKYRFNDTDQIKLGEFVNQIDDLGAKILLSNSDPKNVDENDNFFDDIYAKYNISRVEAKRSINSNGKGRGKIKEILVSNFVNKAENE